MNYERISFYYERFFATPGLSWRDFEAMWYVRSDRFSRLAEHTACVGDGDATATDTQIYPTCNSRASDRSGRGHLLHRAHGVRAGVVNSVHSSEFVVQSKFHMPLQSMNSERLSDYSERFSFSFYEL